MKLKVLIASSIILGIIILTSILLLTKKHPVTFVIKGQTISCQVGHLDEANNPVLEEKYLKHLELFSKYLVSRIIIDSNKVFHCIVPNLQITDNKETIWSVFSTKYFLEYSIIFMSNIGDTINSLISIPLYKDKNKLFYDVILGSKQNELKNIPVCDPSFIKPCMIRIK